jgi:hypothetical protein
VGGIPRRGAYASVKSSLHQLRPNSVIQGSLAITPGRDPATSTSQWRSLELRLMHHYTAVVSQTMPYCDGIPSEAWQKTIPRLSVESEAVLNPMLTLTALHIHVYSPNDSVMAIAVRRYLDRALLDHRYALENCDGLSEKLWLSATILSHIYWLLSHQVQPNEKFELPLQAFTVMRGLGIIAARRRDHLSRLNYRWVEHKDLVRIKPEPELSTATQTQLQSIRKELTTLLDAFNISPLPEQDRDVYMEVKDYVLYHYHAYYSGAASQHLQRFVSYMVMMCPPRYRTMLEEHDPLAMGLMARMLVLLCGVDRAWWVNGGGLYEVVERDIKGMHELMPDRFSWVMNWPCRVLRGELTLSRD